ncbi:SNF2 family N-terminal domain-containing protein [Suillus clintonianus]|uniref:SNF2 family N-terminal domain-containing protein n=1 Tax=Suillus clintonianus TaxID=1904413 RepID=UPI001B869E65|nr:SNF2 family N-terminal domain-containing protein [Suillus clintonianus]KAG2155681.1 SNF2 family N-terminal domain-containing protein [Suillus clintonianus]
MTQDFQPRGGLFFAGSDDEGDAVNSTMSQIGVPVQPASHQLAPPSGPPYSQHGKRLFFADSDDEDIPRFETPRPIAINSSLVMNGDDSESDLEIPSSEDLPRASSVSTMSSEPSLRTSSPVPGPSGEEPPVKKRRLSPPSKVQTRTGQASFDHPAYLGSFLVGNAWSTVRGKGYIKPGDIIRIERDNPDDFKSGLPVSGKGKKKALPEKGKKKQLTLGAMLKSQPPKTTKKADTVVRLTNDRGFEFGRLPQHVSSWVSRLLDFGIVDFKGSTVVDCPAILHSGADLIVSLSVYIRASAFKPPSTSAEGPTTMFNQGQETQDEQTLRERKSALLSLFEAVSLRPCRGAHVQDNGNAENETDGMNKNLTQHPGGAKKKKIEIVGDDEEIEVEEGEELSDNELDVIYKKAQKNDQSMAEMDPPDTFTLTLRGYQKQALMWMHSKESGEVSAREAVSMHPLWSEYVFPAEPQEGIIDLTEDEKPFYFNPYSGELSLDFPKAERKLKGGILADGKRVRPRDFCTVVGADSSTSVGMGKTIMLSALIHMNREPEPILPDDTSRDLARTRQLKLDNAFRSRASGQRKKPTKGPSATLIVAPTSLLSQWHDELQRSSAPGTLKVTVWHGQNRLDLDGIEDDSKDDASITVIITSYGVLASEHSKLLKSGGQSSIFQVEWLRVILDEAHHCKSRTSKTARAVYAVRARRRWAVTGTPIVNKLEDLHSLLQFLEYTPWSSYSFFRSFITVPFLARDPKAIEIVQVILESVLLRREKNMRDNSGKRIVELPAKEITVDTLHFTPAEQKIYDSIYNAAKQNFDQLNAKGLVGKNYTHILAMLMRLRRAVLHPDLVADTSDGTETKPSGHSKDGAIDVDTLMNDISEHDVSSSSKAAYAENVLANLDTSSDSECPICLDVMQIPSIIPPCMHQCCKECIISYLGTCTDKGEVPRCPTCSQGPVKEQDLIEVFRSSGQDSPHQESTGDEKEGTSTSEVFLRRNDFRSSTKLDALVQNLRRLRDQDPYFRAVVFSQFTSFLSLISVALDRERLSWYRFDGSMDLKKRNAAISEFKQNERKPKVLIVSLKAGGVGLNLTSANHVFMMDCWWNAATENQAIDRVHRIGQEKTVYVKHFIVDHTIEGRILQIQKRKTAIVKEAFRGSDKSGKADPESLQNLKVIFGDD